MKKLTLSVLFTILALNIDGQDRNTNKLFLSFTWAPVYYGSDDFNHRFNANIPFAFETNIYYKFIKRVSISAGIGYQGLYRKYNGWAGYMYDPTQIQKTNFNQFRIPFQINCYLTIKDKKVIPYLKSEITREYDFIKESFYSYSVLEYVDPYVLKNVLLNLGIGINHPFCKSTMIVNEFAVGTSLTDKFFDVFHIKIKIGLLFK